MTFHGSHLLAQPSVVGGAFSGVIARLEEQMAAIDRALSALRDVEGTAARSAPAAAVSERPEEQRPAKKKRKRRLSPEGRARLVAAVKKRWAGGERTSLENGGQTGFSKSKNVMNSAQCPLTGRQGKC